MFKGNIRVRWLLLAAVPCPSLAVTTTDGRNLVMVIYDPNDRRLFTCRWLPDEDRSLIAGIANLLFSA